MRGLAVPIFARLYRQNMWPLISAVTGRTPLRFQFQTAGTAVGGDQHVARLECFQRSRHSIDLLRSTATERVSERRAKPRDENSDLVQATKVYALTALILCGVQ